jgi:hypothetical protein
MPECDERFDGFQLDLESNRIAERPIGIRKRTEEVAVRASGSTAMTPVNPDVSRPSTVFLARARNRFDVGLASRTVAFSGTDR